VWVEETTTNEGNYDNGSNWSLNDNGNNQGYIETYDHRQARYDRYYHRADKQDRCYQRDRRQRHL
jgi:hypothetical protein